MTSDGLSNIGTLRSFESDLDQFFIPGIRRIKAEPVHPTELLYHTLDWVYVYIRTPDEPKYFGTIKDAMSYIECVYLEENERYRKNVRDEWELAI